MLILFDQNTAVPIRRYLSRRSVRTAYEQGWSTLVNGELLQAAEEHGFDVVITADQKIAYQARPSRSKNRSRSLVKGAMATDSAGCIQVVAAVEQAAPGTVTIVEIPVAESTSKRQKN